MSEGGGGGTQGGTQAEAPRGERIAKVIARAGICSRRDAERLIAEGKVKLNGRVLATPAITVVPSDRVEVDGTPLATRERTRLWLFHKPKGLVTTNRDPEGRRTVFSALPAGTPRVLSVGRLDINTEGLLLLTNDGGLARVLELPSTGWLRRYRVRAHGRVEQPALDALSRGVAIDGMIYGAIEAEIERLQGSNIWLNVGLREGKNREVKRVLEHLGLTVARLIRISYGPFQLGDLAEGELREVRGRILRDQLGDRLAGAAGADFDAPLRQADPPESRKEQKPKRRGPPGAATRRKPDDATAPKRPSRPRTSAEPQLAPRSAKSAPPRQRDRKTDREPLPTKPDRPAGRSRSGERVKAGGAGVAARRKRDADRRRPS